jgi:hypothetical protein
MTNLRFILLFTLPFFFQHCEKKVSVTVPVPTRPLNADQVPANAIPINILVYNTSCWVEQGKFIVAGICTNMTPGWQKIWLEAVPLNANGNPISISTCSSVIIPAFSDAVPPSGRTTFYASWPVSDFSDKPDSIMIKAMVATQPPPGPILVTPVLNCMKMLTPSVSGQPASDEKAWQVSGSISNPLEMIAAHPRLEVLVYDKESHLRLCTVLNPEDPNVKPIFQFEREGPLQPQEDRPFSMQVYYQVLPQILQEKKIGLVEILPFEARQ